MGFDTSRNYTFTFMTPDGQPEPIEFRWPTDEEWALCRRKRKMFYRQLGRGNTELVQETGEADLRLAETVKVNGARPLTVGEGEFIAKTLQKCTMTSIEMRAGEAEVHMDTMMGEVVHRLKMPTMDQMRDLQRTTHVYSGQSNLQEVKSNMDSAVTLWEKCSVSTEGYEGPVPNIHKDDAIRTLIQWIERAAEPKFDEANF